MPPHPSFSLRNLILGLLAGIVLCFSVATVSGAEISLPDHRLALTIPDTFDRAAKTEPGVLVLATWKAAHLTAMVTKPPLPVVGHLTDAAFQANVRDELRAQGFSRTVREGMVKVEGSEAYLFEAALEGRPISLAQIIWVHEGSYYSLVFFSEEKPISDFAAVQAIIDSVRVLPRPPG